MDDKQLGRRALGDELRTAGFEVHEAGHAYDAIELFDEVDPSVLVTDFQLPGIDGIELIERVRTFSSVPAILITAYGSAALSRRGLEGGADHVLDFGTDLTRIGELARELVREHSAKYESSGALSPTRTKKRRDALQRVRLERLLRDSQGNISEAARQSNMSRGALRYQLKRLRVLVEDD